MTYKELKDRLAKDRQDMQFFLHMYGEVYHQLYTRKPVIGRTYTKNIDEDTAVTYGDNLMVNHRDYNALACAVATARGDIFTSDREVAAFYYTTDIASKYLEMIDKAFSEAYADSIMKVVEIYRG